MASNVSQQPTTSAIRALAMEFKSLQEEPVEGFTVKLVNEDNLFDWQVAIFGPPTTLYQGGYFKVTFLFALCSQLLYMLRRHFFVINTIVCFCSRQAGMKFPLDYPYSPPSLKFLTKVWHPNVYEVS
jgi:ubiquitin-conjugating enzyme E2 R